MKQFIGKVFTLIGGLGLIVLSLISAGFILYDFITSKLDVLTQTVYFDGWIALLSTVFFIVTYFFIAFIGLKNISINRSNKKPLIGIIIVLALYILYIVYIMLVIKDFQDRGLFINTFVFNIVFGITFISGIIIDLNN